MRAKEYAKMYDGVSEENFVGRTTDVVLKYFEEIDEIMKSRNGKSDSALVAVIQEQVDKWRAMSRHVPRIKPDGFKIWIESEIPSIKGMIK